MLRVTHSFGKDRWFSAAYTRLGSGSSTASHYLPRLGARPSRGQAIGECGNGIFDETEAMIAATAAELREELSRQIDQAGRAFGPGGPGPHPRRRNPRGSGKNPPQEKARQSRKAIVLGQWVEQLPCRQELDTGR